MTDYELRELLARTSPGTAKTDWKHGLQPSTIAGICTELLDARAECKHPHAKPTWCPDCKDDV